MNKSVAFFLILLCSFQAIAMDVTIKKCNGCQMIENQAGGKVEIHQEQITNNTYEDKFIVSGNNATLIENQPGAKVDINGYGRCVEGKKYWICP